MEKLNAIEEIYLKKGLISVKSQLEVKDKVGLSMVYSPGVGECCLQIKAKPERFYDLTAGENIMFVLSNGSTFNEQYLSTSPSFMLPELELVSFVYKSMININAFPLVFNSNIIRTSEDVAWMIKHLSPCIGALELYEVAPEFCENLEKDLQFIQTVVILPQIRNFISEWFSGLFHKNYVTNLIIGLIIKVHDKLRMFGVIKQDFLQLLLPKIEPFVNEKNMDEFTLKEKIIENIFDALEVCEPNTNIKILHETIMDFISYKNQQELFYFDYKKNSHNTNSIFIHEHYKGMIRTALNVQITNLLTFLTDENIGKVKAIAHKIFKDPKLDLIYSMKKNYCSIATDGTAILGFGNIGPRAGMPVMEGKICLFQQLGQINVMPLCIDTKSPEDTIRLLKSVADSFNAINLEDISAPNCFVIEEQLNNDLQIPIFHDDQHGTAVVVLAGLINSLKVIEKNDKDLSVVINGAGAAGKAIADLLMHYGFSKIIMVDTKGAIYEGREDLSSNKFKQELAKLTNRNFEKGTLKDVIINKDIFIGVSVAKTVTSEMVQSMNKDPIIFALANPEPEIMPEEARKGGAKIIATGRSDFPNQINNSLVFPGIFKGLIDSKIKEVTLNLKVAASIALAHSLGDEFLSKSNILPYSLDPDVAHIISQSIIKTIGQK